MEVVINYMNDNKMNKKGHIIASVSQDSIAFELGIQTGDMLLKINDSNIKDIFDYHYLVNDSFLTVLIRKEDGEEWEIEIEKDYEEDLGIEFHESLMDQYRSCQNKCVFCFIDQMPPGMRETLYFKDDDARLSFLQGNYITLTNMKDADIDRIILYKLAPINISVHTTNPSLRAKMLNNRFAGDALQKMKRLYDGQIEMNSQIVLCKRYNDKEELDRSISDLSDLYPYMKSLSVVPVGITKYRKNLANLKKFTQEEAKTVLDQIHAWQEVFLKKHGTRFVFASDEWYLTAKQPIPPEEYYENYGQIENGVGMTRSYIDEFYQYINTLQQDIQSHTVSLVTGVLFSPILTQLLDDLKSTFPNISINLYTIKNDFFGNEITVTGLLTGQDIINQLSGKELGDYLILPSTLFRAGEEILLDDISRADLESTLQTPIRIVQSDGKSLVDSIMTFDYNKID